MHSEKEKARPQAAPFAKHRKLFFLVFFFLHRLNSAIVLRLSLGVFHCLLGFGGFLGASFGALFLLLVENLLAPEQFQESLVGAVALVPVGADDARCTRRCGRRNAVPPCRTTSPRPHRSSGRPRPDGAPRRSPRLPSVIIFSTMRIAAFALGTVVSMRSSTISEVTRLRSSERRWLVFRPSFYPALCDAWETSASSY